MRTSTAPIRHKVMQVKAAERKATAMFAQMLEADYWPLRQGYNAAERGNDYDHSQTLDWQRGWRLWHRRHGKAA